MRGAGVIMLALLAVSRLPALAGPADFEAPEPVELQGYEGDAMEPFLSRDGQYLFFNNRNDPGVQTDIHMAERIDALHFRYLGKLAGANSDALDGVPSLARDGSFVFVSPRAYDAAHRTLWIADFRDGVVLDPELVRGDYSRAKGGWLNIDAEISADGGTLYYVENKWRLFGGGIGTSNLRMAEKTSDGGFSKTDRSVSDFDAINSDKLEFAPATTEDELTLYFTRVDRKALKNGVDKGFGIFVSTRPDRSQPFGTPQRIGAITGYVEGPTISPDGCRLYFHKRIGDRFDIQSARKSDCEASES
ncbi:MAG: hypothetical protein R3B98_02990 [Hyphomonas sp.]